MKADPGGDPPRRPITPISSPRSDPTSKAKPASSNPKSKSFNVIELMKDIPGAEPTSLRAKAGWKGARIADVEIKATSGVFQHYIDKLLADQKLREEAAARDHAREKVQEKNDLAALFERLGSSVTSQVQGEVKVALERALKERPPTIPAQEKIQLNPIREIVAPQQKYSSETQCLLKRPVPWQLKEPAQVTEKSQHQSDEKRARDEIRLAEKARKRFEVKLHKDNAEQSRPMSAYEFSSLIDRHMVLILILALLL
jgi:hypothetical protein